MTNSNAIVIGSGFGGLAAAIRLASYGYSVTVLEKNKAVGGRAAPVIQDGFVFDAGPTIVTAPFLLEELWDLCGRKLEDDVDLRPMNPFYRIVFDDGETFDYGGSDEDIEREIKRVAPEDLEGYHQYMRTSKDIFKIGFEDLAHLPFNTIWDMLKVAPDLIRLRGYRTVYGIVSGCVKNPKLRIALSFHPLLIGGNPFTVTSVYTLISYLEHKWGVHSAMGGTASIVSGMQSLIEGQGSEIRLNTEVSRINIAGGKATGVTLQDGSTLNADVVVCNADVAWAHKNLIAPKSRKRWTDRKLDRSRYSNGLFVWYFGTNKRYENLVHHTIVMGPRYKGLLTEIFGKKPLAKDFSLYLHRPTATDPSVAPEGCDAFYVLAPVPHLDADIDWQQQAEPYRKAIAKRLSEMLMPGLEDHIVTSHVATPLHFRDNLNSEKGAGFSLEPILTQAAWFRPHNKSEDVNGLFFVGAGTHPGAGIPGVLSSARILDKVIPAIKK